MKSISKRSVLRWIHIIFSIPIIGYVYSPFESIPQYAAPTRYVFLPMLVLTGLLMWKGHALRRLFSKTSPGASRVAGEGGLSARDTDNSGKIKGHGL